jgi:hypothetical protein
MSFSNFAFEVGGVFLFVAGLMYLTLSGRLGNLFRDRAPKPLFLIALVVGLAVYHWGPMFWDRASRPEVPAPERRAAIPAPPLPIKPEPVKIPPSARARVKPVPPKAAAEHGQAVIVQEVPATEVFVPPADSPRSADRPESDPYESKTKHALKAVGRFLHLRKTEPQF